ncbi:hypothetical protein [Deinococcus cavernae]|uniref:hypothetical protein n=1 Tax=Deinococcus cavernae TaxID=2320857 RepID=UPI001314949F|nr:hypothetical protein [Deinococcus cavernae]
MTTTDHLQRMPDSVMFRFQRGDEKGESRGFPARILQPFGHASDREAGANMQRGRSA